MSFSFNSWGYEYQPLLIKVNKQLCKKHRCSFVIMKCNLETEHVVGKKTTELPIYVHGKRVQMIWTWNPKSKTIHPFANYVSPVYFRYNHKTLKSVLAYHVVTHIYENEQNSFIFVREKDCEKLEKFLAKEKNTSLGYDVNAFSQEALEFVQRCRNFFNDKTSAQLKKHHVPQQMGVVVSGPPGCGKTMFIKHLGEELNIGDVRRFSVTDVENCARHGSSLPQNGIAVFDDIEQLLRERSEENKGNNVLPWLLQQSEPNNIKVSRLLIIVTNYPEHLDNALLRPGRFETMIKFGLPTQQQFSEALKFYMGDDFNEEQHNKIMKNVSNFPNMTLAHVAYMTRLVYSNFVKSWDEAFKYTKKFSGFQKQKNEEQYDEDT